MISRFRDEYRFLSNFYPCTVTFRCGQSMYPYPTAEHAFQAQKAGNAADLQRICQAQSPGDAKRAGRLIRWDPGMPAVWDQAKRRIMLEIVLAKFNQNDNLRRKLAETGKQTLVEGNEWGDEYWGAVRSETRSTMLPLGSFWGKDKEWAGRNYLGQILMTVRMVLSDDYYPVSS